MASRTPTRQVRINPKAASDELSDQVTTWLKLAGIFIVVMYLMTLGYDQAAPFFGLPQASPLNVGGLLLFVRLVAFEVRRAIRIIRS